MCYAVVKIIVYAISTVEFLMISILVLQLKNVRSFFSRATTEMVLADLKRQCVKTFAIVGLLKKIKKQKSITDFFVGITRVLYIGGVKHICIWHDHFDKFCRNSKVRDKFIKYLAFLNRSRIT